MKKSSLWDPYAKFQKTVLPNGLSIYSAYWDRPWMHARFCVHSGSLCDTKGRDGLAHFVEHLVSPNYEADRKVTERLGGNAGFGRTEPYWTDFYLNVPIEKKSIKKGLNIFAKMLMEMSDCKLSHLEKERAIILQEFYRRYPCRTSHEIRYLVFQESYKGTFFEKFLGGIGVPETINKISGNDIKEFFMEHYAPSNMSVVVAGGLTHDEVVDYFMQSDFSLGNNTGRQRSVSKKICHVESPKNNMTILKISEMFPGFVADVASLSSSVVIPGVFSHKSLSVLIRIWRDHALHEMRETFQSTYDVSFEYDMIGGCFDLVINCSYNPVDLELIMEILFSKSLNQIRSEKLFKQMVSNLLNSYSICDITMADFCQDAQEEIVKYGRVIPTNEELEELRECSFEEYCSLLDYLSDSGRWWNLIQVP